MQHTPASYVAKVLAAHTKSAVTNQCAFQSFQVWVLERVVSSLAGFFNKVACCARNDDTCLFFDIATVAMLCAYVLNHTSHRQKIL